VIQRIENGETITKRQVTSYVRDATVRLTVPSYVSPPFRLALLVYTKPVYTQPPERPITTRPPESEPAEPEPPDAVAEFVDALADLMGKVKLPPPDALSPAEAMRTKMPYTSPADWKELGHALVALPTTADVQRR
jgi:hypothetical protein